VLHIRRRCSFVVLFQKRTIINAQRDEAFSSSYRSKLSLCAPTRELFHLNSTAVFPAIQGVLGH